jgi:hypothetical protein
VDNIASILMVDSVIAKKPILFANEAISLFHKIPLGPPLLKGEIRLPSIQLYLLLPLEGENKRGGEKGEDYKRILEGSTTRHVPYGTWLVMTKTGTCSKKWGNYKTSFILDKTKKLCKSVMLLNVGARGLR